MPIILRNYSLEIPISTQKHNACNFSSCVIGLGRAQRVVRAKGGVAGGVLPAYVIISQERFPYVRMSVCMCFCAIGVTLKYSVFRWHLLNFKHK